MKKHLIIGLFALLSCAHMNAQLGNLINKAKQAGQKKVEEKQNNATTTVTPSIATIKNDPKFSGIQDDGITSEVHKSNVGKVVFSKNPIEKANEKSADLVTEISGKDVYFRYYLDKSFYNIPVFPINQNDPQEPKVNSQCAYYIEVLVDGIATKDIAELNQIGIKNHLYEETDTYVMSHNMSESEKLARAKSTTNSFLFKQWPLYANSMKPGEHTVKINVWAGADAYAAYRSKEPVATGEFKYSKKTGDVIPFGVAWTMVAKKSEMHDAALEAQMKKTLEDETQTKCLKLVITDKDWTYFKNALGVIESRQISVQYVAKDKYGYCTLEYAGMAQDYINGKYGRMRATGAADMEGPIFVDCATVK